MAVTLKRLGDVIERFPDRDRRCGATAGTAARRIALSLIRQRCQRLSSPVVDIGGAHVRADLSTPLGLELYRYGLCTPETRVFVRLLRPGDVFVDGGANVGLFSLLGASVVGRTGRVIACEPGPGTMALLAANVALNGFCTLERHQVALSDHVGAASFIVFEDGSGMASFAPEAQDGYAVDVTLTTLDHLTSAFIDRVALVKLDIEGAEVHAIRGALKLIARSAPLLLLEVEPEHLARQGSTVEDLREALAPHGYEAYSLTETGGVLKLSSAWLPPDPARPNLLLASSVRADRLEALTA